MDAVSEVKARLNIEDVISEYVALKRTGKNYKGLSPFSSEKTPSFVVSPEKQIWHDFSSGRGGDVFTFVQEVESLDFKAALELLARKAGVDLEKYQKNSGSGSSAKQKERLHEVLEAAAKFYQVQLTVNQKALDYVVKKRGFKRQTIIDFKIGYSPDSSTALHKYLLGKGFSNEEMKSAGLVTLRNGRITDMFRGRIMIALSDQFGKVVGFTARLLEPSETAPKYINTPSTVLYDKSRHIYGLHLAKKAIHAEKFSVLAEGNLDVVSSHQAGVKNVVATAGTALTEMQLKSLGRFSPDVRLAFDEDRAGLAATERAIPIASKVGVNLSVVTIPSGKDPDELVRQDPEAWKEVISKHLYALDWLIGIYKEQLDLNSAIGKKEFIEKVGPVVAHLDNKIEKEHYITQLAKLLDSTSDAVRSSLVAPLSSKPRVLKQVKKPSLTDTKEIIDAQKIQDRFLAITLMLPKSRMAFSKLSQEMFLKDEAKKLYEFLAANLEFSGGASESKDLNQIKEYVKIISLQFEELYSSVDPVELYYEAARLRTRIIEFYVKYQKQQILNQMSEAGENDTRKYLEKVKELDNLLKKIKE